MTSGDHASDLVPKADFDSLWEEFEGFKSLSASVENALNAQVEAQEQEIKQLRRTIADEQSQKEDARGRLSGQQTADLALHERVNELQQLVEQLRLKNRTLEDRCEALEHDNHKDAFQQRRLEDMCSAAEDRAILAESRAEELEETCAGLRGEVRQLREAVEERHASTTQRDQQLTVAQSARDDAIRDMKLVALRLRTIAEKCGAAR
jgi:chromosome segregation ATPase